MLPSLLDAAARGRLTLAQVAALASRNAADRFGLPDRGRLASGAKADMVMSTLPPGPTSRPTAFSPPPHP
jgi:dihydropyrimidinase/allantoinase